MPKHCSTVELRPRNSCQWSRRESNPQHVVPTAFASFTVSNAATKGKETTPFRDAGALPELRDAIARGAAGFSPATSGLNVVPLAFAAGFSVTTRVDETLYRALSAELPP